MSVFTDKLEALLQRSVSNTEADLVAPEAALQVYADFGDSTIEHIATRTEIPDTGLSLSGFYLGGVVSEEGRAFQIDVSRKDDFKHGERTRPVYYIENNMVYSQPDSVTCHALLLDVPGDASDVDNKGDQLQTLCALQAAQHILQEDMAQTARDIIDIATLPSIPSPPSDPSFAYSQAASIAPTATTIGTLPSAPQIGSLSRSITKAPSQGQLDLSTEIDENTSLNPPSKTLDFSVSSSLPDYSGPTSLSIDFTDHDTYFSEEDPEMTQAALHKLQTEIQKFQADAEQALSHFQNRVQEFQAEVQEEAEKAGVNVQDYQTSLQTYQQKVERQVQEFNANLERAVQLAQIDQQGDVQEAELDLEEAQADLQADLQEYESEVEKEFQQAQIAAQEAQQAASNEQEVELRNAAQDLQTQIEEYQADLRQYEMELQQVQTELNKVFREAEIKMQQRQQQTKMQGFDMQRLRSRYKRQLKTFRKLNRSSAPYRVVSGSF